MIPGHHKFFPFSLTFTFQFSFPLLPLKAPLSCLRPSQVPLRPSHLPLKLSQLPWRPFQLTRRLTQLPLKPSEMAEALSIEFEALSSSIRGPLEAFSLRHLQRSLFPTAHCCIAPSQRQAQGQAPHHHAPTRICRLSSQLIIFPNP